MATAGRRQIAGLREWLDEVCLTHLLEAAETWCEDMGAAYLEEVHESWEDFADGMGLTQQERGRIDFNLHSAPPKLVERTLSVDSCMGPPEDPHRYKLLEELGRGATGRVRRSTSVGGSVYAVKQINLAKIRKYSNFEQIYDMLYHEIAVLFSMQHARLVPLIDVVEDLESLWLVMELAKGGELGDYIFEKGRLMEAEGQPIFVQIIEGLLYIHSKGIIHCDLKPENILIDRSTSRKEILDVKLIDFGHSQRVLEEDDTASAQVGTPLYWPPEISNLSKLSAGYDRRVDLWSLGAVLYVMLVGRCPFDGGGVRLQQKIQQAEFSFEDDAVESRPSLQAQSLIRSLLRPDPSDRLPLEWCLVHPWVETAGVRLRQILQDSDPLDMEECFVLPETFSQVQEKALRLDLKEWMAEFRFSAIMQDRRIVANLGSSSKHGSLEFDQARAKLRSIVLRHFGHVPQSSLVFVETGLKTIQVKGDFQCWSSQLFSYNLRVSPVWGVGLDLRPELNGLRVYCVHLHPGQHGLQVGDLIFNIDGNALCGSLVLIEQTFGNYLRDDVQVAVRRDGTGERPHFVDEYEDCKILHQVSPRLRSIDSNSSVSSLMRQGRSTHGRWILDHRRRRSKNTVWGGSLRANW